LRGKVGEAVLAFADLADITRIEITTGAGDDTLTVDLDSFGANHAPAITIDAGEAATA
jgi:hypothetical protein